MTTTAAARVAPEKADFRPALLSLPVAGLSPEKVMLVNTTDGPTLEDNVIKLLNDATDYYAKSAADAFSQEMYCNCLDLKMESAIERMLWIAFHVVCKTNYIDLNAEPIKVDGKDAPGYGLHFWPQFKLENYRADFSAYDHRHRSEDAPTWVIECDGHDFHERTKQERQYEKQRDRFFTVRGYKILRFTGSEIVRDPYAVAAEIIKAVTGDSEVITPKEYWG